MSQHQQQVEHPIAVSLEEQVQQKIQEIKFGVQSPQLDKAKQTQAEQKQPQFTVPLKQTLMPQDREKLISDIEHKQMIQPSDQIQDNLPQNKCKQGGAQDQWIKYAHQKLKNTRGQGFTKTKGRLKNKNFQGSGFTINSVKLT